MCIYIYIPPCKLLKCCLLPIGYFISGDYYLPITICICLTRSQLGIDEMLAFFFAAMKLDTSQSGTPALKEEEEEEEEEEDVGGFGG
jgi:hypothetical protein